MTTPGVSPQLLFQGCSSFSGNILESVRDCADRTDHAETTVISAYASSAGVDELIKVFEHANIASADWLLGMDGIITEPAALERVRTWTKTRCCFGWDNSGNGRSLHAKVFSFFDQRAPQLRLVVGSGNATTGGLSANIEAAVALAFSGSEARDHAGMIEVWFDSLTGASEASRLSPQVIDAYRKKYRRPSSKARALARVEGGAGTPRRWLSARERFAWIEVVARGGSDNQIEICRDLAGFFAADVRSQVPLQIRSKKSGILYSRNVYRFRHRNTGFRVEVDTNLARELDLASASRRRDVIVFTGRRSSSELNVVIYRRGSAAANALVKIAKENGRLYRTASGVGGRYYSYS